MFTNRFFISEWLAKKMLALLFLTLFVSAAHAQQREYVITSGGPALRQWENYRRNGEQHDRWWGNFIRPARMRIEQIQKQDPNAMITWLVYKNSYDRRSVEDKRSLTELINSVRDKFHIRLVWITSGTDVIAYLNNGQPRSRVKVCNFEYFGHSNKYCFMFDYSNEVYGTSKGYLHEKQLTTIHSNVFTEDAFCKSWGCHTGESMSKAWRKATGIAMWGADGKTDYSNPERVEISSGGHWTKG
jgi:hypothetical protein